MPYINILIGNMFIFEYQSLENQNVLIQIVQTIYLEIGCVVPNYYLCYCAL